MKENFLEDVGTLSLMAQNVFPVYFFTTNKIYKFVGNLTWKGMFNLWTLISSTARQNACVYIMFSCFCTIFCHKNRKKNRSTTEHEHFMFVVYYNHWRQKSPKKSFFFRFRNECNETFSVMPTAPTFMYKYCLILYFVHNVHRCEYKYFQRVIHSLCTYIGYMHNILIILYMTFHYRLMARKCFGIFTPKI